jgi:uncharacterized membrane protein
MDLSTIDGWASLVLIVATVITGLHAGLYFAFTVAVMPALAVSSDRTFVETMRHINQKILNPWFLTVFMGSAILPLAAAVLLGIDGDTDTLAWAIVAAILGVVAFGITAARNVPLNEALDAAGPVEEIADLATVRAAFEAPWVRWNLYRTIACVLGLIALTVAVARHG